MKTRRPVVWMECLTPPVTEPAQVQRLRRQVAPLDAEAPLGLRSGAPKPQADTPPNPARHLAFRAAWALAALAIAGFIFWQSARAAPTVDETPLTIFVPEPATPEQKLRWDELANELAHVGLFFGLAFSSLRAYGRLTARAALAVASGALLYGISDELHQALVPARDASAKDLGLDLVGAVSGSLGQVAVLALVSWRPK